MQLEPATKSDRPVETPNAGAGNNLRWQSRLILLIVLPAVGSWVALRAYGDIRLFGGALAWALIVPALFAGLVWRLRAATAEAALAGGAILASLCYSTASWQAGHAWSREWLRCWKTALPPVLLLFLLTYAATRYRRGVKERRGTAEGRRGRNAAQIAANLGAAALAGLPLWTPGAEPSLTAGSGQNPVATLAMLAAIAAALAEATADTLSSELGQVLGGEPRMITTGRRAAAGADGAVSFAGTVAGCLGAALVVLASAWTLGLNRRTALIAWAAGVFGLFFDSLLGATLERRGWMNNDAVNFASTLAAALAAAAAVSW